MIKIRKILPVPVALLLCLFLSGGSFVFAATLTDLPSGSLYTPYIISFFEGHIITGDLRTGKEDRKFRPLDPIARSEMAKITALTRLAEKYSTQEDWSSYSELAFVDNTENKLKPYYKCTASSCSSIGGVPFSDVTEKDPDCFEKNIATGGSCEPWYSQYVYYAVSYGYIKGYESKTGGARVFSPENSILRIHALKMAIAENGNVEPDKDPRYTRLSAEARARRAFAPACLRGAETYILKNNGNDKKLLAYALLADRLDLFGKNCEVFGKAEGPQARADFLQKPVTRQEVPRYLSLTTLYHAVEVDSDPTIATAEENKELGKDDETYVSPGGPDVDPKTLFDLNRRRTIEPEEVPLVTQPKLPKLPSLPKLPTPDETLPAKIFQTLPASTRLCGPFGCTVLKTKTEVEMLSVLANPYIPGEYIQNVSYDGQLYTVDCEVIKSSECLVAMAKTASAKTKPALPANWIEWAIAQAKKETEKAINEYFESIKKAEIKPVVEVKQVVKKEEIAQAQPPIVQQLIEPGDRIFKTSIPNVNIRASAKVDSEILKTIPSVKTDIIITNKAIQGEYIDAYKTDRWYPVRCDDCKDKNGKTVEIGYVLATIVHAEWIKWDPVGCKTTNSSLNKKRDLIVLHFTVSNSELNNERTGMNNCDNEKSSHFIIDRNGKILQAVEDFYGAWHANPENNRSIGIEIINWGIAKEKENKWYNWSLKNEIKDIYDVSILQKNLWRIWNMKKNPNEQEGSVEKSKYWQKYTDLQYRSLMQLTSYIEEKFNIPHQSFDYPIPDNPESCNILGFYFSPQRVDWGKKLPDGSKALTKEWNEFANKRKEFRGIISHKNVSEKYDPGPHLDLTQLKLITQEQINNCQTIN